MPDLYIAPPIETDENALYQVALARVRDQYPGWTPQPGSMIDLVFRFTSSLASIDAENATSVMADIFRYFGVLANKPPLPPSAAHTTATFTVVDDLGYTVPALTPVGLKTAAMTDPIGFQLVNDLIIPNGSTSGAADIVAIAEGAENNNLDTVVRVDSLTFVTNITISVPSFGGADAELVQDYLDRLSRQFETWTETPIISRNFVTLAPNVPGVYRAASRDNYNPADGTTNNEKYVAVCPIDQDGNAVSSGTKAAVQAYFEGLRELNFVCPVVDPNYTTIDVEYTAHTAADVDPAVAEADIAAALGAYINPGIWGMPFIFGRPIPIWNNLTVVRINKVVQAIENVAEIDYADPVKIGVHSGARSTANVNLTGGFPLPRLGTIYPTISSS